MSGVDLASNTYYRVLSSKVALVVAFLVSWTLAETLRRVEEQPQVHQDSLDFAASDLAKSIISLFMWFLSRRLQPARPLVIVDETQLPLWGTPFEEQEEDFTPSSSEHQEPPPLPSLVFLTLGNMRSTLSILAVGLVYALRAYTDVRTHDSADPFTLSLVSSAIVLGILVIMQTTSWRNSPSACWHASLLQFSGLFIARDALFGSASSLSSLLVAFVLCNSVWISFVDLVYGLHRSSSVHLISAVVFAQSCLIHLLLSLFHPSHSIVNSYHDRFALALQALPLLEVVKDILTISVIHQYGSINQGILISIASTFFIVVEAWNVTPTSGSALLGFLIAILGCGIFVLSGKHTEEKQSELGLSVRRCFAAAMLYLVALGYVVVVISQIPVIDTMDWRSVWRNLTGPPKTLSDCRVPESSALIHPQTIANYSRFDNVLLIVFFSHARYNANLDFHKEVYGDYFPNIVYVGPATREDKGFTHSYDVLVDSFQSEEDLSDPLFYKMAGRMAHHMLYTVLREYGCYDGYLWVPFDTLLNVPRLEQFDQSLFWYHSPWGHPVPNPALGNVAESTLNVSRHAPPAMISPDPSINLTETWRGWGLDWWWGDPHVGVSVCMDAFNKVPEDMRAHFAELTDGKTRLIGGSADTLYIPGRHRTAFMDVLGLFLETNCFLEIATPTTVHLVVAPGEPIQFVDHWWIWEPPFNASFVREKWAQGYEVDTFHTFHWGERGEEGVWRGDHQHVADVRRLQQESAVRQGLRDIFPVNPGVDEDRRYVP